MRDFMILIAFLLIMWLCFILSSCTYSINMVHTEGLASDVVDENQKADANVEPNIGKI